MSYTTLAAFLFARPSTVSGVARILDFWGTFDAYNRSRNEAEADAKAIYSDWRTVGENLWEAYEHLAVEEGNIRERRVQEEATV
jgi:hypothetical protein